jgi:GTPase
MADYYMDKAKTSGFDKFSDIGYFIGQIFKAIQKFKGNVVILTHPEEIQNNFGTSYKAKTVGEHFAQIHLIA